MKSERGKRMNKFVSELKAQQEELEAVIRYANQILKKAPEGSLRVSHEDDRPQYYHRTTDQENNVVMTYLRKRTSMELIQSLAQKSYAQKLLTEALHKKHAIERFSRLPGNMEELKSVYEKLSPDRKSLVIPYELPEEEYAVIWRKQEYPKFYMPEEDEEGSDSGIYTEKGERVRSKSEKILADKLYMMDIPYHYEKPLPLNGAGVVHPDFTVLNKRTRNEYYWEHLGMMDCPEYAEKAVLKIEAYERNGFFHGDRLILTYETQNHPINLKMVERLIGRYLM